MAKEEIKKILENSKKELAIKDDLSSFKKKTLDRI